MVWSGAEPPCLAPAEAAETAAEKAVEEETAMEAFERRAKSLMTSLGRRVTY